MKRKRPLLALLANSLLLTGCVAPTGKNSHRTPSHALTSQNAAQQHPTQPSSANVSVSQETSSLSTTPTGLVQFASSSAQAPGGVISPATKFAPANAEHTALIQAPSTQAPAQFVSPTAPLSNNSSDSPDDSLEAEAGAIPVNLPTALAMVSGQHPVVGFAQWRVREAYALHQRANVLWLPSIQTGLNYRRRDGNYQAVDGAIVDVNLNSLNYGLGAGAIAAGSPTRPGVVAQFHLADAIFLPKSTQRTAWARSHAAAATLNQQLLSASLAYLDLLEAYQELEIVRQSEIRTKDVARITQDFADAGEGLQTDAQRMRTEVALLQTRLLSADERRRVASTRLARAVSMPMSSQLVPQDTVAVPLELALDKADEATLIARGLACRPELKESQALVAAACEALKREKYAPYVPSVLLGFSTSSFGGGLGSSLDNFGGRYDVDALMVWETRNLGLGEQSARRERSAQVQQATFAKLRVLDQVAQEVAEANAQVEIRKQQLQITQDAIPQARECYERSRQRILEGQGLPIEVLQSLAALETIERTYAKAVCDYNRAQLQLQWAEGWPITAQ